MIQDAHDRMTDPEELDCNGDVTAYSSLDVFPGEPESSQQTRKRARKLLEDDAPPLSDREIIAVFRSFRSFRWLSEEGDVA